MTGQELFEHVRTLARDLDAKVWVCTTCPAVDPQGRVTDSRDVFLVLPPDEPTTYLLALHELGHLASVEGWGKVVRLQEEADAWRWALEQSLIDPPAEAWAYVAWALRSYARDRRYKRTPDFDRLLEEAERNADVRAVA